MSYKAWYNQDADYNINARSFMDYLARHNKFMKVLVEDYEVFQEVVSEELKQIKFNAETEVEDILLNWLDDGTLERIINDEVFGNKADTVWVENQLNLLREAIQNDLNDKIANVNTRLSEFSDDIEKTTQKIIKIVTVVNLKDNPFFIQNRQHLFIHGYNDSNMFKEPVMFDVQNVHPDEDWIAINDLEVNNDLFIKVGNFKIKPSSNDIIAKVYGLNFLNEEREDQQIVQMIFDNAINGNKKIDFSECKLTINKTIYLDKTQYPRKRIHVLNMDIYNNAGGTLFNSHLDVMNGQGGYYFENLKVESVQGNGLTVFTSRMIRMEFSNPEFYFCDNIWVGESLTHHLQTIYVHNAYIVGGKGHVFESPNAYDIEFSGLVEHRMYFMNIGTPHSVNVHNAVIEGLDGYVYKGGRGRSLSFRDCYFEHNTRETNTAYFIFEGQGGQWYNVTFDNNLFQGTPEQVLNDNFYIIKGLIFPNAFTFKGNWSDCHMVQITNGSSYHLKNVRECLNNNYVEGVKNLLRIGELVWTKQDIEEGTSRIWGLYPNMPSDQLANEGVGRGQITNNGVTISKTGIYGGVGSAKPIPLNEQIDYVIGLKYRTLYDNMASGKIEVQIQNLATSENVVIHKIPILENLNTVSRYLTLPSFKVPTTDEYKVIVYLIGTPTGSVLINNLNIQYGTISNPVM